MKNNKKTVAKLLALTFVSNMVYAGEVYDLNRVLNTTLEHAPEILQKQAEVEGNEAAIKIQTGQFDHNVFTTYKTGMSDAPVISYNRPIYSGVTHLQSYQHLMQAGILKQFRTGISAEFDVNLFRKNQMNGIDLFKKNDVDLTTSNESTVNFKLNVPLLKGATSDSVAAAENATTLQYEASKHNLTFLMSAISLNAINAYWDYKIAEETLEINRASEKRIQDWTTEAERIFIKKDAAHIKEAEEKYFVEIQAAQAYLANKHLNVVSSIQALEQARVALLMAMGTPYVDFSQIKVSSEKLPKFSAASLKSSQLNKNWVSQAMENRTDLKAMNLLQEANSVMVKKYERDLLPQLDVTLNAGYQGLSEGSSSTTFGSALYRNVPGPNLSGQIGFAYPLENNTQEGLLKKQEMTKRQTAINIGQLERSISATLDVDVSLLDRYMVTKDMAEKAISFYQPTVNNLAKQTMKDGHTMLFLLQYETTLVSSMISKLQVDSALAKLIADVRHQTGTLISSNDAGQSIDMNGLRSF
ncbi:MAG: TolC family protein [Methylococcales bacterium]|nr:TolC family protein [Methylococcales bacterium]MDD5753998.1 TolC family protein [Methylococcales bacterium]